MKYVLALCAVFFGAVIARANAVPTSQPDSAPTSQPATTRSAESIFHDAINSDKETWTTAMPENTFSLLGYRSVPVKQTFVHNTYPGDSFLPRAKVPGSAGTTILNRAQYIDYGFRWQRPLDDHWAVNFDATGLFAVSGGSNTNASGFNQVDHRSANDTRYRGVADFIYTDTDFGYDLAIGTTYSLTKHLYIGAVADFTTVYLDNGWDRYSSFISQSSKQLFVPAGGLKIGYRGTKNSSIEATLFIGKNGVGYFVGGVWDL